MQTERARIVCVRLRERGKVLEETSSNQGFFTVEKAPTRAGIWGQNGIIFAEDFPILTQSETKRNRKTG